MCTFEPVYPIPKNPGNSSTNSLHSWLFPEPGGPHSTSRGYGSSRLVRVLKKGGDRMEGGEGGRDGGREGGR